MTPHLRETITALVQDLRLGAAFLTRIPMGHMDPASSNVSRCLRVIPLIGALIGALTGLVYVVLAQAGVPTLAAAAVAFLASAMLTGALHEDGMADVADSLGGYTRERRLEIMRDSRIGTFGGLALIFGAIAKVTALSSLPLPLAVPALAACGALGRGLMASLSRWTPQARTDGLASAAGRPSWHVAITAGLLACVLAALLLPHAWLAPALGVTILSAMAVRFLAMQQVGGYTGDVLGCAEQTTEIALLLLFAALASNVP